MHSGMTRSGDSDEAKASLALNERGQKGTAQFGRCGQVNPYQSGPEAMDRLEAGAIEVATLHGHCGRRGSVPSASAPRAPGAPGPAGEGKVPVVSVVAGVSAGSLARH